MSNASSTESAAFVAQALAAALARLAPHGLSFRQPVLVVCPPRQELWLVREGKIERTWPVSTSARGLGCQRGSHQTPMGSHRVEEKIGAGAPLGAVFKGRKETGQVVLPLEGQPAAGEDAITTRILWLGGLEPGKNQGGEVDTHDRYIYIHGTREEGWLGQPRSIGCVRMANQAVAELFDLVEVGTLVEILEG
ncbi:MAG: L,D-transpeptidase [Deltaproteobacteria bacterium]|nr:L,D-transpeptidase [Deltaproteobacteria bacterium]